MLQTKCARTTGVAPCPQPPLPVFLLKVAAPLFERYDLDNTGTMNSKNELQQLVTHELYYGYGQGWGQVLMHEYLMSR